MVCGRCGQPGHNRRSCAAYNVSGDFKSHNYRPKDMVSSRHADHMAEVQVVSAFRKKQQIYEKKDELKKAEIYALLNHRENIEARGIKANILKGKRVSNIVHRGVENLSEYRECENQIRKFSKLRDRAKSPKTVEEINGIVQQLGYRKEIFKQKRYNTKEKAKENKASKVYFVNFGNATERTEENVIQQRENIDEVSEIIQEYLRQFHREDIDIDLSKNPLFSYEKARMDLQPRKFSIHEKQISMFQIHFQGGKYFYHLDTKDPNCDPMPVEKMIMKWLRENHPCKDKVGTYFQLGSLVDAKILFSFFQQEASLDYREESLSISQKAIDEISEKTILNLSNCDQGDIEKLVNSPSISNLEYLVLSELFIESIPQKFTEFPIKKIYLDQTIPQNLPIVRKDYSDTMQDENTEDTFESLLIYKAMYNYEFYFDSSTIREHIKQLNPKETCFQRAQNQFYQNHGPERLIFQEFCQWLINKVFQKEPESWEELNYLLIKWEELNYLLIKENLNDWRLQIKEFITNHTTSDLISKVEQLQRERAE